MSQTKYLKGECQHCAGHLEFPAETIGMQVPCPHCGQTTELLLAAPPDEPAVPRRVIIWTAGVLVILGLGLVGTLFALNQAQKLASRRQSSPDAAPPQVTVSKPEAPLIKGE